MKTFDLQRMAFDELPVDFLLEVALRSFYSFLLVFIFLKITGRRGVRQLSLFEVIMILTLGSAAGDVALYDDTPMLTTLMVFVTIALLYRLVIWLMGRSDKVEDLLEGKPIAVVQDGELVWEKLQRETITEVEFFMALRLSGVEHLGQLRLAIIESDGGVSTWFYRDEEVRPGLSVLPAQFNPVFRTPPREGEYACRRCSRVAVLQVASTSACPRCGERQWVSASRALRVT